LSGWRVWGAQALHEGVAHPVLVDAAPSLYRHHRFPAEIIGHCVWLYYRFPLSLRDVQEMMAERGVLVTYETIESESFRGRQHAPPTNRH
jgi:hypothetical protein